VSELDCVPNGHFTRELEPLPEHLGALDGGFRRRAPTSVSPSIRRHRAAFVDAQGVPLGEEFTLALAAEVVLEKRPARGDKPFHVPYDGCRCAARGVPLFRTPVGEAHVVSGMRAHGAVVGGEGNGA